MPRPVGYAIQIATYGLFALVIGYFSDSPQYVHVDPDMAQIKLSFSHPGQRAGECRRLTPEEIAALPPNMRRPLDCPRGRLPVLVELELDGEPLYSRSVPPSGVAGDGPSTVYQRFTVVAGEHRLTARLRDSDRADGYDYEYTAEIRLQRGQNFVVDFRSTEGGFIFM